MLASTATELALLITVIAGAVAVLGATVATIIAVLGQERRQEVLDEKVDRIHTEVQGVHAELRTLNGSTVGDLADADETRRVLAVPPEDRTEREQTHVARVPEGSPSSKERPTPPSG